MYVIRTRHRRIFFAHNVVVIALQCCKHLFVAVAVFADNVVAPLIYDLLFCTGQPIETVVVCWTLWRWFGFWRRKFAIIIAGTGVPEYRSSVVPWSTIIPVSFPISLATFAVRTMYNIDIRLHARNDGIAIDDKTPESVYIRD